MMRSILMAPGSRPDSLILHYNNLGLLGAVLIFME